jgi:hypothetical protein
MFVEYVAFIFSGAASALRAGKQSQIHVKHAEPSRADTTPERIKAPYSININQTRG